MKKLLIAAVLLALAGSVLAQGAMKMVTPDQLVWKDHPVFKGAQVVVLIGDPAKAGDLYVQRVKLPPNYQIAPHTHLGDETLTVLTGSLGVGMGEKFEKKGEMLKAGENGVAPASARISVSVTSSVSFRPFGNAEVAMDVFSRSISEGVTCFGWFSPGMPSRKMVAMSSRPPSPRWRLTLVGTFTTG